MSRPPLLSSACLAATCSLLLGGCVAAGDVRPYAAMAPIVPVVAP
ncbi:flagellar basal body L-ring protein, partial [Xanthomonas oryzae pv. oryzae]